MPRRAGPWSKIVEEMGVQVRVYERHAGAVLYRDVTINGQRDRRSLGHRDRKLAEQQARALARRLGEMLLAGEAGPVTIGQLFALYRLHRFPLLSEDRRGSVTPILERLEGFFGPAFRLDDLSQHAVDRYAAARRTGELQSKRHRSRTPGVRAGTIRSEFNVLAAVVHWGQGFRTNGRRLIAGDPLAGVTLPRELNVKRPIATPARYQALLAVADVVEPTGRLRLLLVLARATGRRLNAMCQLRAADLLLTEAQLVAALGAAGMDTNLAAKWPHGAIRWGEATDKLGFESIAPMSVEARAAVDAFLRLHPRVGDAPIFFARRAPGSPIHKKLATYWLNRAEKEAGLPKLERGGWHALRRLWASERRHLPAQDVAAAGGWRDLEVMRSAYQQADAETIFRVITLEGPGAGTEGGRLNPGAPPTDVKTG